MWKLNYYIAKIMILIVFCNGGGGSPKKQGKRIKIIKRPLHGLQKDKFYLSFWWSFAECGNRKALRLKAQGVYSCK